MFQVPAGERRDRFSMLLWPNEDDYYRALQHHHNRVARDRRTPLPPPARPRQHHVITYSDETMRVAQRILRRLLGEDSEPEEEDTQPKVVRRFDYRFRTVGAVAEDWECAVCLTRTKEDLVLHPYECHAFHRGCLRNWLDINPCCPLCRGCVTPLLMYRI